MAFVHSQIEDRSCCFPVNIIEDAVDEVVLPTQLLGPLSAKKQWDPKRPQAYSDLSGLLDSLLEPGFSRK
jgi:hypothetical protein